MTEDFIPTNCSLNGIPNSSNYIGEFDSAIPEDDLNQSQIQKMGYKEIFRKYHEIPTKESNSRYNRDEYLD